MKKILIALCAVALLATSCKNKNADTATEQNQTSEAVVGTSEGNKFVDLKSQNPKGEEVALSDYAGKGKVVLVDFWASWCPPCKAGMPEFVKLYEKYKGDDFELVGVSMDEDVNQWSAGLSAMNMTWPQMSDLKGWESNAVKTYNVKSIPQTLLIDKNGIIVAKNLHGEALSNKIAELIK